MVMRLRQEVETCLTVILSWGQGTSLDSPMKSIAIAALSIETEW